MTTSASTPSMSPTPTQAHKSSGSEQAFADYLASLVRDERRAALAALRRGLGKRPGQAAEMFPYIVPWLSDTMSPTRQGDYFLVASLFATHQISWPHAPEESPRDYTNLGASFHRLTSVVSSESIEKRFVALLNAPREDLPEHLRYAASLLRAHDIPIDWAQLLRDLAGWSREDRRVQRAWAQTFWRHESATPAAMEDTENAESEATIPE